MAGGGTQGITKEGKEEVCPQHSYKKPGPGPLGVFSSSVPMPAVSHEACVQLLSYSRRWSPSSADGAEREGALQGFPTW